MAELADRLRAALERVPAALRAEHVAGWAVCELPASQPPWQDTGLALAEGDAWSVFAGGRVVLSEEAGLWNGASFHLWARVGKRGPLLNGGRDTWTFRAPHAGPLELGLVQGEWASRDGAIDPAPYALATGGIEALVVRWRGDPAAGVAALAGACPDEPLFAAERARLADPVRRPEGWEYLWFLGEAAIFSEHEHEGRRAIRARTADDVGILQRRVELPFRPGATLAWRWRVDALPSPVAENSLPTHDYLSLAVEFENGQDLTYYWSAALPPGTHYRCPLPGWDRRETHWVVRSGAEGLGAWHAERRPLYDDYCAAVGPAPERIVGAWLIAVSIFQKGAGAAEFAEVELRSGDDRVVVL